MSVDTTVPAVSKDPQGPHGQALPHSPYPGLRPFLDYEDLLLFGRDRRIEEVVARLGATVPGAPPAMRSTVVPNGPPRPSENASTMRFVAVLGGSGSGKSSLIRAGVVPRLRQFGLPAAGELWVAVVCTPGSNFSRGPDSGNEETPISRLAREIEAVLHRPGVLPGTSLPATYAAEQRRLDIAELLRQPGGLDTVVDVYGPELDLPPSVNAGEACVLIVIDQFEELFHRSNRGQADVEVMVQRVIDHFHLARTGGGSQRCFLAITMRSEHLQDCAAYIGLPEAINAGSYLISRLDRSDLRAVIERPAQRFLRLCQRLRPDDARLPDAVVFDPRVVDRLIDDTLKLKDEPDHLPLLQQALARLWQAACQRESVAEGGVPHTLTVTDLQCMVLPAALPLATASDDAGPVIDGNVLVLSLQNWADHAFSKHPPDEQVQISKLLLQLAYRDPASGTYTQQRYAVARHPLGADRLYQLLDQHWIHGVNYLHWDQRNPDAVTLKVSHEAFVRGWRHFKDLVDVEAERFERFKRLLESCQVWRLETRWHKRLSLLLEGGQLQRMEEARIEEAIGALRDRSFDMVAYNAAEPPLWQKWRGWIDKSAQAKQLSLVDLATTRRYYRHSRMMGRVSRGVLFGLPALLLLLLLVGGFSMMVQQPVIVNATRFIEAADRNNVFRQKPVLDAVGDNVGVLGDVLKTVGIFEDAKVDVGMWPLNRLLPKAYRTVEPGLNANLRSILAKGLWLAPPGPGAAGAPPGPNAAVAPLLRAKSDRPCGDDLRGFFLPVGSSAAGQVQTGILVESGSPAPAAGANAGPPRTPALWLAMLDADDRCSVQAPLQSLPPANLNPVALFDQDFTHLLVTYLNSKPGGLPFVTAARVIRGEDRRVKGVEPPFTDIQAESAAAALRGHAASMAGQTLATRLTVGGLMMQVGNQGWRVVAADRLAVLAPQPGAGDLEPLPAGDTDCVALWDALIASKADYVGAQAGQKPVVYNDPLNAYCLFITQVAGQGGSPPATVLQVYAKPLDADLEDGRLARKLPSLVSIELAPRALKNVKWLTGKHEPYRGWLIFEDAGIDSASGQRYTGLPWSTEALKRLGLAVQTDHCQALPSDLLRQKQGCTVVSDDSATSRPVQR